MELVPERGHRVVRTIGCLCCDLHICTLNFSAVAYGLLGQYECRGMAFQTPGTESDRVRCCCSNRARKVRTTIEDLNTLYLDAGQHNGGPAFTRTYTYLFIYSRNKDSAPYEGHLRQPTHEKY